MTKRGEPGTTDLPAPHLRARAHTREERAAIVDRVCTAIANGTTVSKALLAEGPAAVNRKTLWRFLREDAALYEQFAQARLEQAHSLAEACVDLADSATPETANAVRLAVDTRKWYASKLAPKLFSERVEVEHAGSVKTATPKVFLYNPEHPPPVAVAAIPASGSGVRLGVRLLLPDNHRDPELAAKLPKLPRV